MMRAREHFRSDPLFDDPFADAFVAAAPPIFADGPSAEDDPSIAVLEAAFEEAVSVRTCFYDKFVADSIGRGCTQVVLLGAGLDSRAFRLQLPTDLRLFEIDTHEVLAFKERVLARLGASPLCRRVALEADLRGRW